MFHQYTLRMQDRDAAWRGLAQLGVGTGVHYPTPIHQQPLYRLAGYEDVLPQAEAACRQVISLPVHPALSQHDLEYMVAAVANVSQDATVAAVG